MRKKDVWNVKRGLLTINGGQRISGMGLGDEVRALSIDSVFCNGTS